MRALDRLSKLMPLLYLALGAVAGGTANWVSQRVEFENQKRVLAEHIAGFSHSDWFSAGGVLHPSLSSCLDRLVERACHEHIAEYERTIVKPLIESMRALNPSIRIPDPVDYR